VYGGIKITVISKTPLIPINLEKTPIPWNYEFALVTSPELIKMAAKEEQVDPLFFNNFIHVARILHWVIKIRWDSKHNLPAMPKGHKNDYKSLGYLYSSVIDVIQELDFLDLTNHYTTSAQWFVEILTEGALDSPNCDQSKNADIKQIQSENRSLFSSGTNPFNPELEPSTCDLINRALTLCDRSDIFRKKLWGNFRAARIEWLNEYRKPSWRSPRRIERKTKTGEILEEIIVQQGSRGRSTEKLPPLILP
jgi:hypothetical protein